MMVGSSDCENITNMVEVSQFEDPLTRTQHLRSIHNISKICDIRE